MANDKANDNNNSNDNDEQAVVQCGTTKGNLTLHLVRRWSPHGYDRAVALFEAGFYDQSHFFRMVPHFLVQFGISYGAPNVKALGRQPIPDDDPGAVPLEIKKFPKGTISYAGSGPNSRTSQLFISLAEPGHHQFGKELWETPVGYVELEQVTNVVEQFYSYGDMPPWGNGPVQGKIHAGSQYIDNEFPKLDRFRTCTVTKHRGPPPVAQQQPQPQEKQRELGSAPRRQQARHQARKQLRRQDRDVDEEQAEDEEEEEEEEAENGKADEEEEAVKDGEEEEEEEEEEEGNAVKDLEEEEEEEEAEGDDAQGKQGKEGEAGDEEEAEDDQVVREQKQLSKEKEKLQQRPPPLIKPAASVLHLDRVHHPGVGAGGGDAAAADMKNQTLAAAGLAALVLVAAIAWYRRWIVNREQKSSKSV